MRPLCVLTLSVLLLAGSFASAGEVVLLEDDFESGLDNWTALDQLSSPTPDEVIARFDANGNGIFGPNTDAPGSWSVGYSSDQALQDSTGGNWIQRQWPAAVAPDTYYVTLEADVYVYTSKTDDPHSLASRMLALTDELYDDPYFNYDGGMVPSKGVQADLWSGDDRSGPVNGRWIHSAGFSIVTTTTGNIEVRLLMHDKYASTQTVAWANVHLKVWKAGEPTAFEYIEDFSAADALDPWTEMSFPPKLPGVQVFDVNDPLLLGDVNSPGSLSAGYASDMSSTCTRGEWIQQQLTIDPGTHSVRIEFDWYVKKDHSNPWAVGNRVYLLWDGLVGDPTWDFDTGSPTEGVTFDRWNQVPASLPNGEWAHFDQERQVTTTTGNLEFRLLLHNKESGAQAVAWDNVRISLVTPCDDLRFDFDGDLDVDQDDFGVFQRCYTGADALEFAEGCVCANADGDTDVDTVDLTAFETCASGPDVLADAACMN